MAFLKKTIIWLLTLESRLIIRKYKPFIIAVTGSVGKTATKDAIFTALSGNGHVRKSDKSLNSEIGLPLTIIGVPNAWKSMSGWIENLKTGAGLIFKRSKYPEVLVLEIGADHPGDIKKVVKWLKPDISVITKVGETPVHVEFFNSPAQVFEEKSALVRALSPGGTAVLFADEPKIVALGEEVAKGGVTLVTFGTDQSASVGGNEFSVAYEDVNGAKRIVGISFSIIKKQVNDTDLAKHIEIKGVVGKTFMYPVLAAVAVAISKGVPFDEAIKRVEKYHAPKGRMNIVQGKNGSTIIDDTYNSSPDAVAAALEALKMIETSGKKIAVLGDMMELGLYSAEAHHGIAKQLIGVAHHLVTVGPRARVIAEDARELGMTESSVASFSTAYEAADALQSIVGAGDVVLIKGSQSVRMERITKALMADMSKAEQLLVRQEKEWLEKK